MRATLFALLFSTWLPLAARAATPELHIVLPRGAQRGTEVSLTLNGARLADAQEILFFGTGITVTKLEAVSATQVKATARIEADAAIGEHCLRLRTATGISELRTFWVSPYPIVPETEPNNDFDHAQAIALNTTVAGVIDTEDVDGFVVEAKQGTRLTAEVVGMRLATTLFDPHVAILNPDRFELASADDTALALQDPIASVIAPVDGKYVIRVRDASFGGNGNCMYLLHVGTFPRPTSTLPLGGRQGQEIALTYLGDVRGPFASKLTLPNELTELKIVAEQDGLLAPTPNALRVSPFDNQIEVEPNDDLAAANVASAEPPLAFNGVIGKPGDVDFFRFKASKGQVLDLRVVARALRSPLDSVLVLTDPNGALIASNDDSPGPDSYLRFNVPSDGEFVAYLTDHLRQGGSDYAYRFVVRPTQPFLTLTIPQVNQNSQERQAIAVPRGNRFATLVRGTRADFGGEVVLSAPDLPEGVAMECENLAANLDLLPVVFAAAADAPLAAKACALTAKCADENVKAPGRYTQAAELVIGPNNQTLYTARVNQLAVAVTQEAPFKVHLIAPKAPLVQSGAMNLRVVVERSAGFTAPVSVRMLFNPPGVGSAAAIDIPANQTEGLYPINANDAAQVRKWKICVLAMADVGGPLWVASELTDLEVAPPMLAMKLAMAATEQGKPAQVFCEIEPKLPFTGKAIAHLVGLPSLASAADVEITAQDKQAVFTVNTDARTPAGQHKTLFCQVTVMQDGEPVLHNLGHGGVLRVDPPPAPVAASAAAPPPPPPPAAAAKPLSRLEQLRLAEQHEHPRAARPVLEVFPAQVSLETARDEQSLVGRLLQPDGITRDVTRAVAITASDPGLVKIEGNVVRPAADGHGQLVVSFEDQTVSVPLQVSAAAQDRPISFKLDVMPVFMKGGCNSGGCHGAARGKDGFRLSLFGFDPDGDYYRLTREAPTRRVDLALPVESLIIDKALGRVPHTGGTRFGADSPLAATLLRWLDAGAPADPPEVAAPDSLEILPKQMVLAQGGATQALTVRAHYSDGSDRDVTRLALFLTNNDTTAKVSDDGVITTGSRGEAFVMARFATFTVGTQVIVVPAGEGGTPLPELPAANDIDRLVNAKLAKLRVTPSPLCKDEVFLRRAFLDIVGLLPTRADFDRFIGSADPAKREQLVDELLGRKEFVELWVMKFAELLKIRSSLEVSYKSAVLYFNWLDEQFGHNVPVDQIVRGLLQATGGTYHHPETNYFEVERDSLKIAENTAQAFMGMRVQCAQCHNHPFDRWTMNDYYGFAAFFAQIGRKPAEDPRETIVFNSGGGEATHPVGGRVMKPKFLGGAEPDVAGKDRRAVLASWLASDDNPYFARNLANLVWAHFLGRGIIDPVDDVRVSNPAVNPELLDALAQKFTGYHYDFKRFVRDLCTSRTYQLASECNPSNASDDRNFSHAAIRRVRAEVLLDCLSEVTEVPEKFQGLPLGDRAVQIADGQTSNYFLTTFGRSSRESVCSCEVKMEPNLSQALHLLNGDTVQRKVAASPVIARLLEQKRTPAEIVEELYLRCFSRKPDQDELAKLREPLAQAQQQPREALDDVFWALLNSREFLFNH
ncbi:MAG: DUF1553 domain-containing protein [Planctomycetota bacterium]